MRKVEESEQGISSLSARSASKFAQSGERIWRAGIPWRRPVWWLRSEVRHGGEFVERRLNQNRTGTMDFECLFESGACEGEGCKERALWIRGIGGRLFLNKSESRLRSFVFAHLLREPASIPHQVQDRSRFNTPRFHTHDSLQMASKYEDALFDAHRQMRGFVYTHVP